MQAASRKFQQGKPSIGTLQESKALPEVLRVGEERFDSSRLGTMESVGRPSFGQSLTWQLGIYLQEIS
jgi:hypothetical protein